VVSTLFAIAASQAGYLASGTLILFAAWTATFALLVRMVPIIWAQAARFTVTDRHVIWRRGHVRRSIQRDGVSFARIEWNRRNPRVGDLELVRAVPTGALRRGLTVALQGVASPDRVWSIVRGAAARAPAGRWDQPLTERLEQGERVRWRGSPVRSWLAWLPMSTRRTLTAALGVLCMMAAARTLLVVAPIPSRLLHAGVEPYSIAFLALVSAVGLSLMLMVALGLGFLYVAIVQPPRLGRRTQYVITDSRIILQRGRKEIHVDRSMVVDVVDRSGLYGGRDVFLVLDGPQSRAFAAQGAFGPGERTKGFVPVFHSVSSADAEHIRAELAPGAR
jgi:hypothetical protein